MDKIEQIENSKSEWIIETEDRVVVIYKNIFNKQEINTKFFGFQF